MMVVVDYSRGIFVPRIEIGGGVIAWSSISFVGVAVFYTHLDMSGFFCIGGGSFKSKGVGCWRRRFMSHVSYD